MMDFLYAAGQFEVRLLEEAILQENMQSLFEKRLFIHPVGPTSFSVKCLIMSQGGSSGKWQTPHQKAKYAGSRGSGRIEPGDVGIWATCAKGQERRAREELQSMFEEVSVTPWPNSTLLLI
jgi:hypothetical protein